MPLFLLAATAPLPVMDAAHLAQFALESTTHTVAAGETVFDLAQRYGTTVSAIVDANGLADASLIRPGDTLSIPSGTSSGSSMAGTTGSYTVRVGDTLSGIAASRGTTPAALAAANGISAGEFIHPGQVLTIPGASYASSPSPGPTAPGSYTVRSGDTLSGIAAARGLSVSALAAANGISAYDFIHPGKVLTIPSGSGSSGTTKRPAASTGPYTVQAGDTLTSIAAASGSTVAAIAKASGISPSGYLQVGQRLTIPSRTDRTETGVPSSIAAYAAGMPSRSEIRDLITATALDYGVDPKLALAIAWMESGWQQGVTSSVGAVGTMQVMPTVGEWIGSVIGRDLNLRDTHDNVTAGVALLRQLNSLATSREEAIAAYYQGLSSVRERGMYADTRQYVANVTYFMTRL